MADFISKPSSNAIICFNKKILLFLRDNNPSIHDPNKWALVGGEIENNETFRQAMRREIIEEINVLPKSLRYLGYIKTPDEIPHFIFLVKMTRKEVDKIKLGNEGQKVKFFSMKEIREIELATYVKGYLEKYGDYLEKWLDSDLPIEPKKIGLS